MRAGHGVCSAKPKEVVKIIKNLESRNLEDRIYN